MALIDVSSFEDGYILANILRTIAHDIVARPSISAELLEFQRRFELLRENIRSNTITNRYEVTLTIQEIFCELQRLRESSHNEQ